MHMITTAAHAAYLDPMTGAGLLVCPRAVDDLFLGGPVGLHGADWDHMVSRLDAVGFEPSEDLDGGLVDEPPLADGRSVVGLFGRDSITSLPGLDELAKVLESLRAAAERAA